MALLSNEFTFVLPLLLVGVSLAIEGWPREVPALGRAVWSAAPPLAVAGVWAVVRFLVIAPPRDVADYARPSLGWHVPHNAWLELQVLFGGVGGLVVALAAAAVGLALVVRAQGARGPAVRALGPVLGLCALWIALHLAPFAGLGLPQVRFATPLEPPVGAGRWGPSRTRCGASTAPDTGAGSRPPSSRCWSWPCRSACCARGWPSRGVRCRGACSRAPPRSGPTSRARRGCPWSTGCRGSRPAAEGERIRKGLFGMAGFRAYFPERNVTAEFVDLGRRPPPARCPRCRVFGLTADGTLTPLGREPTSP